MGGGLALVFNWNRVAVEPVSLEPFETVARVPVVHFVSKTVVAGVGNVSDSVLWVVPIIPAEGVCGTLVLAGFTRVVIGFIAVVPIADEPVFAFAIVIGAIPGACWNAVGLFRTSMGAGVTRVHQWGTVKPIALIPLVAVTGIVVIVDMTV